MARIRTIKPEFFTSPDTAGVSHSARLLYIAMWSWADDYGRGEMNLLQLRAFAFPEEDQWLDNELQSRGKEFQSLCKEVVNGFGLTVYKHRGRSFYDIPSWDDHQKTQRRAKSKYPAPDDPESTLDLRFHENEGISEIAQGSSESPQGKGTTGTGEQGNRGTGDKTHDQTSGSIERDQTRITRFDEFWEACPRKVGKQKAREKYRAAVKRAGDEQTIIDGIHRLAQDPNLPETRFIPHPTTWLERDGWEDEPLPPRTQTNSPFTTAGTDNTVDAWLGTTPQPQRQEMPSANAPFDPNIIEHQEPPF